MSGSGQIDLDERTFHAPDVRVVIVTTATGGAAAPWRDAARWRRGARGGGAAADAEVDVLAMLRLLAADYGVRVALNEGGPLVLASFLAAGAVDELFLTLAPQLAGRTREIAPARAGGGRRLLASGRAQRADPQRQTGERLPVPALRHQEVIEALAAEAAPQTLLVGVEGWRGESGGWSFA